MKSAFLRNWVGLLIFHQPMFELNALEPLQDGMTEGNPKELKQKPLKKSEGLKPHCVYPSSLPPLSSSFSMFLMPVKDRDQYSYDRVSILLTQRENETKERLD